MRTRFFPMLSRQTVNVLQLGLAFLVVFTAFNGTGFIEELVLNSLSSVNKHSGYYSQAIIYAVFTLSNFVAPPIVGLIGPKWSMVLGAVCYTAFMVGFLHVMEWYLYLSSALVGFGAAILWTGQGNYLTLNSNPDTIGRNSGILWAMLQSALLVGGVFLYVTFRNNTEVSIDDHSRLIIFASFSGLSVVGILIFMLLRSPRAQSDSDSAVATIRKIFGSPNQDRTRLLAADISESQESGVPHSHQQPSQHQQQDFVESISAQNAQVVDSVTDRQYQVLSTEASQYSGFVEDFIRTFRLLFTREMLFLSVVFFYTGIEISLWMVIYPTALGFTKFSGSVTRFGLVGLNAIFCGVGEVLGGASFGLFGHRTNKYGRNPIVILGCVVHFAAFYLIYMNIPDGATIAQTIGHSYISPPNQYLALVCSFLLGLADSCWNTQIYSLLGSLYSDESAPAFALYKFFQSASACATFYYGAHLQFKWQLLILAVTCLMATLAFIPTEFTAQRHNRALRAGSRGSRLRRD